MIGMCGFRRLNDFFLRSSFTSVRNVFTNRSIKEPGVLQHHSEQTAQITTFHIRNIYAIHFNCTISYLIEAHQKID
ncbi:hypothetical protein D3C80_1554200 [compost metagenome]